MTTKKVKRKLAAIFSADVKGYSRLMGDDEVATIRTLEEYREVMSMHIERQGGRVVDSPGDNLLAEFSSVVDAVESAVEVQRHLKTKNAELPENRKMEFRIGINLGDVIEEGERIYGDGVNIAARIESLADAGGICISGTAFDQVKNKLNLGYEFRGKHDVKNIEEPVRVYKVLMEPEGAGKVIGEVSPKTRQWQKAAIASLVVIIIVAGVLAIWNFYLGRPSKEPASSDRMAFTQLHKPSIAVLPFVNMSRDPEQEYFSDGMTEDLITDLSKISGLFVIARNSVFTYKGKPVKVEEVGRDLNVQYVLEGSVRKAGNRVRISAQLIEATTKRNLWAERYDRDLEDIFALQDEVTEKIVAALSVKLTEDEQKRLLRKYTDDMKAYDYYLRGLEYYHRMTGEANIQARQMLERAVDSDPEFAAAYAYLGLTHWADWALWGSQEPQTLERAFELAKKAIALDDQQPEGHALLGEIYLWKKQYEQSIAEMNKAIAIDPNAFDGFARLASVLNFSGRPDEAIEFMNKAMKLNPVYPVWYPFNIGHAYFLKGQYEEAIVIMKRVIDRNPNFLPPYAFLAVSYVELKQEKEAHSVATELKRLNPNHSFVDSLKRIPYKDEAILERIFYNLRKAGVK
ncbi:MAG: adenylate/guanylate cyclase domain-containing protein [Candidatus Bathyarchaeia archaeon]